MTLSEWVSKPEKSGKKTCWRQFSPRVKGQRGSVNLGKGSAGHKGRAAPFAGATLHRCGKNEKLPKRDKSGWLSISGNYCLGEKSWEHRTFHGWKVLCFSHAAAKKMAGFSWRFSKEWWWKTWQKESGKNFFFSVCLSHNYICYLFSTAGWFSETWLTSQ